MLALAVGGCATPPAVSPPSEAALGERTCPSCGEQAREIAQLRQELANRDAELRDLRSSHRDQVKVLQESAREVTRARAKLRRLATQADAASYIAEVEVALQSLRSSTGAASNAPLIALARGILASTAEPFARGDYGAAMDRAAQAEQLIAVVSDDPVRRGSPSRAPREVRLQVAIPLRATVDSMLRRQPLEKAPVVGALKKDTPLVAHASKGGWMHVATDDGRWGWISARQLGVQ